MTTVHAPDQTTDDEVGLERAEELTREHPGLVKLARVGWVAKGVVYTLTGVLALFIALDTAAASTGSSGQEASPGGAIAQVAESPGGAVALYVIAVGLVLYSLWRIFSVLLPASSDASSWLARVGYLVSAGIYLVLAWTAVSIARHAGGSRSSEDSRIESFTRDLLGQSYGQILVFVGGAVVVAIAAVFLWKAFSASFESQLAPGGVGPLSHRALILLGRVGWVGRSAMMGLIGFFICRAAVRFDPDDAQGLDGSLRNAATTDLGTVLVLVVAGGLIVYGLFCMISAPRRLLVGADQ